MQMLWGGEYRTGRDYDVVTKIAKSSSDLVWLCSRATHSYLHIKQAPTKPSDGADWLISGLENLPDISWVDGLASLGQPRMDG